MHTYLILAHRDVTPHNICVVRAQDRDSSGDIHSGTVDVVLDIVSSYQLLVLPHSDQRNIL